LSRLGAVEGLRPVLARWKHFHIKVNLADEAQLVPLTMQPQEKLCYLRAQLVACAGAPGSAHSTTTRRLNNHSIVRPRLQKG
ncbi:hypothetical protein P7K49_040294, partial [Saguinus oedipus]